MSSPAQHPRYARQRSLPGFGLAGQEKLAQGSALVIGAGGLGAPVLMHLVAAGVGRIGVVDADRVEETNLHRQLLYTTADVGQLKVEAAAQRLRMMNPLVDIKTYATRFTRDNAADLLSSYDLLIDGTDNFATRYLCNDIAVLSGKANVYGAVLRFEGQLSVFAPHLGGPCYRCLFPSPPPPGAVPNCAEGGVLGVLPGLIGTMQAGEAIKLLAGVGRSPIGKLLHVDAAGLRIREISLRRDPQCALCGENPTIKGLIDYEAFAPAPSCSMDSPQVIEISQADFAQLRSSGSPFLVLDVREPQEVAERRIPESLTIPLGEVISRLSEIKAARAALPENAAFIVHCHAGKRSAKAISLMQEEGVEGALNLAGGISDWQ